MGRKTHGPYLVSAIEYNDITKVSDILSTKFRDKSKVKHFLVSEVRRLASEYTEVPLLLAASLDDPTILKYFVTKHDVNINHVHEYGFQKPKKRKTALLVAVRRGLYSMVDTILALNGDVNIQDHKGRTPLHHAVRRADYRMAKLLVSRGAQVSINDVSGNSPLHIAAIFGHMELVRLLLRHGGDLYKKGQHGAIPIHMAAKEGHASLVRMFIEQCEVNANIVVPCYDEREKAPLHVAAMEGHSETVFTLLEHCRADINIRDSEGETPLHCVALKEYDPLGMKSKEDFTETVKVLLNYGAEVNTRNSRGETALHLAARNEFQKVLEVLVLAGTDPLIEDHDKNKAIDLVAPDDTVSKQTLKSAMADRERLMTESMEVRARGFAMNLQHHLPFGNRSQSTLNMPLAGMHSAQSHGRLFPNHGSTFGSSNYIPHGGSSRQVFGGQFHQSSHSHSSSSSSKRRSNQSMQSIQKPAPSTVSSYNQRPPVPLGGVRKTKSVEVLDQQTTDRFNPKSGGASHGSRIKQGRHARKNSYQESEATSFWSVTPPGSLREEESDRDSKHSMKHRKTKSVPKLAHERRLVESDEELDNRSKKTKQKKPGAPMKFLPPKDIDSKSLGDSDYFLDDDDSVDALEVSKFDKKKKTKTPKPFKTQKPAEPEIKPGLSSWLDQQAKLVKAKAGPVAHSTPPLERKTRRNHSDDDDSSEDSSTSDSEIDGAPIQMAAKPKPLPPPKPSNKSVARMGVPVLPSKPLTASKESLGPRGQRYQKDNPDVDQVIQLEVNDSYTPGETVIRVIPINPSGPSKIHTVNQGTSSTTFLRLQGDASGSISSEQVDINDGPRKRNDQKRLNEHIASEGKPKMSFGTPPKSAVQDSRSQNKSKNSTDSHLAERDNRPVAKPRESRTTSVTAPSSGGKDKASRRPQQDSISESDSASASEEETAIVSPAAKPGVPGKLSHGFSSPFVQSPKAPPQEQSFNRKAGLVFQRAGANSNEDFSSPVSMLENGKDKGKKPIVTSKAESKNATTNPSSKKGNISSRKSGSSSHQQDSDSEETESSEEDDDSEDEDDGDAGSGTTAVPELRTIKLNSDGNLSYTLVGGNVDGVFVHELDRSSEAAKNDLRCGDQILKANDQVVLGRTRDEAMQILRAITGPTSLVVRRMPQNYRAAVKNDGMTDLIFVRAHFNYDPAKKGEIAVREGDLFCVSDTFPDGNVDSWKAQKVNSGTEEPVTGFIPNRTRANQITVKQRLAQGKGAPDQRGGTFMRSFRRAKSADRNSREQDDEDKLLSSGSIISYEKVSQRISNIRRPVVIVGLFCDQVVNMLVKDSPDLFETVEGTIENLKDTACPVNVRSLQTSMSHGKHCVTILAPPSIEFLQHKTEINPITIYLSPVSKALVKTLKAKLAPFYNKNNTYMYEEAVKFEKNYAHLFTASVPYTGDDWWFFNLKEAITRIQNKPVFQTVNPEELETRIRAEMNRLLPEPVTRQPQGQARSSRDRTARLSRTTDDLPHSPTKTESNPSSDVSSPANSPGLRSIMKPQQQQQPRPSTESVSSDQGQGQAPVSLTFHRLHSHNFEETKSGKKRTQTIQSHETPL